MAAVFADRDDAGRRLGAWLAVALAPGERVVVLGLPRGGVPVAARVAEALDAPLDVVVVRKLALPRQPELALGAVGEGGVRLVDRAGPLDAVERTERAAVDRRVAQLRQGSPTGRPRPTRSWC